MRLGGSIIDGGTGVEVEGLKDVLEIREAVGLVCKAEVYEADVLT